MNMRKKQQEKENKSVGVQVANKEPKQLLLDWLDDRIDSIKNNKTRMSNKSDMIFHESISSASKYKRNMFGIINKPDKDYIRGLFTEIYNPVTGESILDSIMCNYSMSTKFGNMEYGDLLFSKTFGFITSMLDINDSSEIQSEIELVENIKRYIDENYHKIEDLSSYSGYDDEYGETLDEPFMDHIMSIIRNDKIDNTKKLFVILRILISLELLGGDGLDYNEYDALFLDSYSLHDISILYIDSLNNVDKLYKNMTKLATITLFAVSNIKYKLPMSNHPYQPTVYNNKDHNQNLQPILIRNVVFYNIFYMTGILSLKTNDVDNCSYIQFSQSSIEDNIIDRFITNMNNTFYVNTGERRTFLNNQYISNIDNSNPVSYMTYILACTLGNINATLMTNNANKLATIGNVLLPIIHKLEFNGSFQYPRIFYNQNGVDYVFGYILNETSLKHLSNPLTLDDMILDYICSVMSNNDNVFPVKSLSRLIGSKLIVNMITSIDSTNLSNIDLLGYTWYGGGLFSESIAGLCGNIIELCDIECMLHVIEVIMDKYKNKVNSVMYDNLRISFKPYEVNELYIICKSKEVFKHTVKKYI